MVFADDVSVEALVEHLVVLPNVLRDKAETVEIKKESKLKPKPTKVGAVIRGLYKNLIDEEVMLDSTVEKFQEFINERPALFHGETRDLKQEYMKWLKEYKEPTQNNDIMTSKQKGEQNGRNRRVQRDDERTKETRQSEDNPTEHRIGDNSHRTRGNDRSRQDLFPRGEEIKRLKFLLRFYPKEIRSFISANSKAFRAYLKSTPKASNEENIVYTGTVNRAKEQANNGEGIYTLRISSRDKVKSNLDGVEYLDENHHFGNPFVVTRGEGALTYMPKGSLRGYTTKTASDTYRNWLEGKEHTDLQQGRREWIVEQIESGKLDNASLLYYKDLPLSHAIVLRDMISESKKRREAKETNDTISNENKGDNNGLTRLQDNDKTISEGIPRRHKPRSIYSGREKGSQVTDKARNGAYRRRRFGRVREELFPNREETKRKSLFSYYNSKIRGITEEDVGRYLDSIFPDSKIKNILFHGTSFLFDKFDNRFRNRQDPTEADEILDSNLAFFVTDNIVSASYYSINSKMFYIARLINTFKTLQKNPDMDHKGFFEDLQKLKYFSEEFEDVSDIKDLSKENSERLDIVFSRLEEEGFKNKKIGTQDLTDNLHYTNILLKEIERIETAMNNGNIFDYNILGSPNKKSIHFAIGRNDIFIEKNKHDIYLQVDSKRYTLKKGDESEQLNHAFNTVLDILSQLDKRYNEYGFNTEIMPVVINARDISSRDYSSMNHNDLNGRTEQANVAFEEGKDTVEYINIKDPVRANNYGVFNPEDIHILGTEADIKALKEFLGGEDSEVNPLDSDSRPSNRLTQQDGTDLPAEGNRGVVPKKSKEPSKAPHKRSGTTKGIDSSSTEISAINENYSANSHNNSISQNTPIEVDRGKDSSVSSESFTKEDNLSPTSDGSISKNLKNLYCLKKRLSKR